MILLYNFTVYFLARENSWKKFSGNFDLVHWIPEVENSLNTKYGENR